jgi:hypothetical protein
MMLRYILSIILLFLSLSAFAQITGTKPNDFTEETDPNNSNFEFYSQLNDSTRRASFNNVRKNMVLDVMRTAIGANPDTTGNTSYLMTFVRNVNDSIWVIDADGDAFLLFDPSVGSVTTTFSDDTLSVGDDDIFLGAYTQQVDMFSLSNDTIKLSLTGVDSVYSIDLSAYDNAISLAASNGIGEVGDSSIYLVTDTLTSDVIWTAKDMGNGMISLKPYAGTNDLAMSVDSTQVTIGSMSNKITFTDFAATIEANGTGDWVFRDNRSTREGLKYHADYSSDYVDRSIPDWAAVQALVSDSIGTVSGVGEVNDGANLGDGSGVYASKSDTTLQFKSLIEGTGVTITATDTTIVIDAATGSGILEVIGTNGVGVTSDSIVALTTDMLTADVTLTTQGSGSGQFKMTTSNTSNNLQWLSNAALISIGSNRSYFNFIDTAAIWNIQANGEAYINDLRTTKTGLEYLGDYSADYSDRTLPDWASVQALISDSLSTFSGGGDLSQSDSLTVFVTPNQLSDSIEFVQRQFITTAFLQANADSISWKTGEVIRVNGFSGSEGTALYEIAATIDLVNEFHVRDTTFFDLGGGKYAILSKQHNDYIYPEMVGALGDGVADDTRALRILHFYADNIKYGFQKTYKLDGWIAVKPRQVVLGNGCRIEHYKNYQQPAYDCVLADNAYIENIHIQGMDTLINPAIELPGFTGYPLYRPELGNIWNQSGILAQDVDSLVLKDLTVHNYRQGITVNSQVYSGPEVKIWERDTDSDWQDGANWAGAANDNRIYIRDCDLGENLFGILGGGNKLIDVDGLIGDVQPPDTMPVTNFAPPHLVYITSGGNAPSGYCETFIGKNIVGLPSRNTQDVSILKLASVETAIVENLIVDSIATALEFYGSNLYCDGIKATRLYGRALRLGGGDGNLPSSAEATTRVIRNVHAEHTALTVSLDLFGTDGNGYEVYDYVAKYSISDSLGTPTASTNGQEAFLIRSDSNYLQDLFIDHAQSPLPMSQAVDFEGGNYNIVKNVRCNNCKNIVQEFNGTGNYIEYNPAESRLKNLVNYDSNEAIDWDLSSVYIRAIGGVEIPTNVNTFRWFNFARGQTVQLTDGKPAFASDGPDGPDYPVYFRFIGDGINSPVNGFIGDTEIVEYPPFLPATGDTVTFEYYYEAGKFYLAERADRTYADNPAGSSDNVQSALDDLHDDIQAIPTVSPIVTASTGRATVDSILNISPSADIGFSPQNGDIFYADFTNPNFTEKGFYGYEEGTWKKFMFDTTAYVAITDSMTLDYYPNSVGAYSVRKLRFGYSGDCIRVRRSSDNAEQNIGFDGNGDLDTTALKTFVGANDGFVVTWFDQSGAGNNLGQSDNSEQPKIVSSGTVIRENGLPAIESDGTDDWMFTPIAVSDTLDSFVGTVHVVAQVTNPDSSTSQTVTSILPGWDGTYVSRGYIGLAFENSAIASRLNGGNTVFDAGDEEVQSIFSMAHLAPDSAFVGRLDGADIGISSTGANNVLDIKEDSGFTLFFFSGSNYDQSTVFAPPLDADDYAQGKVQEVIWYFNNNWSERAGIQTDMNTYFSVY